MNVWWLFGAPHFIDGISLLSFGDWQFLVGCCWLVVPVTVASYFILLENF